MVLFRNGFALVRRMALCTGFGLVAAGAVAQEALTDMTAGPPSGRYTFTSSTPKSLPELLRGPGQGEAASIVDDRRGGQVILLEGVGDLFLVHLAADQRFQRLHDLGDGRVAFFAHQL